MTEEEKAKLRARLKIKARLAATPPPPAGAENTMSDAAREGIQYMAEATPPMFQNTGVQAAALGAANAAAGVPEGIRQLFNKVTGDKEELATLNAETQQREEAFNALPQVRNHPLAADVGGFAAALAPGLGAAKLLSKVPQAAAATGKLAGALRAVGAGAAGGAAAGATAPLTPAQEAGYGRLGNTASGAALGAAGGAAIPAGQALGGGIRNLYNKVPVEEATARFFKGQTGATKDSSILDTVKALRSKTKGAVESGKKRFDDLYTTIEQDANLPTVPLSNTRGRVEAIVQDPSLTETLQQANGGKKILDFLNRASAKNIVDDEGNIVETVTRDFTFGDVRQTLRQLKSMARRQPEGTPQKASLNSAIEALEADLDDWAKGGGAPEAALTGAREIDDLYRAEQGPLINRTAPVGKYTQSDYDEGVYNRVLSGKNAGANTEDFLNRVPGARDDARNYYAQRILRGDNSADARARLRGDAYSSRDVLFSPSERQYMTELADTAANRGGNWLGEIPVVGRMLNKFEPGTRIAPYGFQKSRSPYTNRNLTADVLRSYAGTSALTEE